MRKAFYDSLKISAIFFSNTREHNLKRRRRKTDVLLGAERKKRVEEVIGFSLDVFLSGQVKLERSNLAGNMNSI